MEKEEEGERGKTISPDADFSFKTLSSAAERRRRAEQLLRDLPD
jgi:hypothetical protein